MFVKIFNTNFIPGLGNGPFLKPVNISEQLYRDLKKLNYTIEVVENLYEVTKVPTSFVPVAKQEEVVENEVIEEDVSEDVVDDVSEDVIADEEDLAEEIVEEVVEDETAAIDPEELTVKELKAELTALGIEFKNNALKKELVDLLKNA